MRRCVEVAGLSDRVLPLDGIAHGIRDKLS
jgi:hypothetical protein